MSESVIDPIGVCAMGAATVVEAEQLGAKGGTLQSLLDSCADLVPGEPRVQATVNAVAGNLSQVAGWATQVAQKFVHGEQSLGEITKLGYWLPHVPWDPSRTLGQNIQTLIKSDEFNAAPIGLATELLNRYRVLTYPGAGSSLPDIPRLDLEPVDTVFKGTGYVTLPSGIQVPAGSSADPYSKIPDDIPVPDWLRTSGLSGDPEAGTAPLWARAGAKGLFVVGAGLTLYGSFGEQWDQDQVLHPDWSTGHRIASATTTTVVVGGSTVGGAYLGAEAGGEIGATIGTAICPGVGTVVGGVVGAVGGAFVGSKVGKAVGTTVEHLGGDVAGGAKKVWKSIF